MINLQMPLLNHLVLFNITTCLRTTGRQDVAPGCSSERYCWSCSSRTPSIFYRQWDVASIHNPDNPDASSLVGTRGEARGLTPARLALESGVFHKKWLLGAVCIEWLDRLSKPIQSLSK
jgi:hypothetical protein